jgi:hypothetical protein
MRREQLPLVLEEMMTIKFLPSLVPRARALKRDMALKRQ